MDRRDFWVFGYGSLMWNPGFPFEERRHAILPGFHRRFCIRSTIYRGTPEQPGLVLGIDAGGECNGMAFRVAGDQREAVLTYLYDRELPNKVYTPTWVSVLIDGVLTEALTFVVKRDHRQFTCLSEDEMSSIIATIAFSSTGGVCGNFSAMRLAMSNRVNPSGIVSLIVRSSPSSSCLSTWSVVIGEGN